MRLVGSIGMMSILLWQLIPARFSTLGGAVLFFAADIVVLASRSLSTGRKLIYLGLSILQVAFFSLFSWYIVDYLRNYAGEEGGLGTVVVVVIFLPILFSIPLALFIARWRISLPKKEA